MIIVFFCLFIVILIIGYLYIKGKVTNHFPANYPNVANRGLKDKNKATIVCFGDSNTHGNVSYDWVKDLRAELPNMQIFNAGRNSDLTFTLLKRIDEAIACEPDFITILIGTNDINSSLSKSNLRTYQSIKKIIDSETPNIETFEENYLKIVEILKTKTRAKIALLTLPMMGEDLYSNTNKIAEKYSDIIKDIGIKTNLELLPIREGQVKYLQINPSQTKYKFSDSFQIMIQSVTLNYFLGWSWDKICEFHKTQLSPDFLHQNSIAGTMIKEEVLNWIFKNEK
jgi:lysophospholipase L1-like esterase